MTAAASSPSSSPSRATAGCPDHEKAVTTPSPARNVGPPRALGVTPVPVRDRAPMKIAGAVRLKADIPDVCVGAVRLKPDTTEARVLAPVGLTPDTIGDVAFAAVVSGFSRTTAVVSG